MSTDKKVAKNVDQLSLAIAQVERSLAPIFKQPLNELIPKLTAIQRCELEALIAYSINTLFWIYLKVNGVPPKEHPVMSELQRVQKYITKINDAKKRLDDGKDDHSQKRMRLDREAAGRLINNSISSPST